VEQHGTCPTSSVGVALTLLKYNYNPYKN